MGDVSRWELRREDTGGVLWVCHVLRGHLPSWRFDVPVDVLVRLWVDGEPYSDAWSWLPEHDVRSEARDRLDEWARRTRERLR